MFYQITLSDRQIWFKSLTEDGFLNSCTSISKIIKLKKRIGLRFWNDYAQLHTSERRFQFDDYFLTSSNDIFYFWIWKIETQFKISETLHRQDVCMLESKWYISRLLARPGDKQEGNFAVFSVITTQVSSGLHSSDCWIPWPYSKSSFCSDDVKTGDCGWVWI